MTEYSPQWKEKAQPGIHAVRDMEYFQGMYPQRIKELQKYVAYQCDAMDYSGSPIYDEYPEVLMIEQACQAVCGMIPQSWFTGEEPDGDWTEEEKEEAFVVQDVEIMQNRSGGRPPWGPPPWGPPPRNNWLSDIVKVLFMNEIQRRRCHMGRC